MRTKTVYCAIDGKTFDDQTLCRNHEERLFEQWLKDNREFNDFLKHIKTVDPADHPVVRATIKKFHQWLEQK